MIKEDIANKALSTYSFGNLDLVDVGDWEEENNNLFCNLFFINENEALLQGRFEVVFDESNKIKEILFTKNEL